MNLEELKIPALLEARKSYCNFQHASLIVYQGRIVASGHNDHKAHSEQNAIFALQRLLCNKQKGKER
ncbi:MAG: hypothetical protein H0U27_08280 [Nitrosopumilus sp.]|nr:hypothetical protein [Nitrosopumilus sp.]